MSHTPTRLLLALILGVSSTSAHADETENRERLREMPLSHRQDLLKNLDRFRSLPSAEQNAIRELDRQIAGEDPAVRARHLTILRRYHVWLASLPEPQRKAIQDASPDERMNLINEYLHSEPKGEPALVRNDSRIWTQLTNLSPVLLADQAHWIRLWLGMTPAQKEQLNKKGLSEPERIRLLEQSALENGMRDERPALRRAEAETLLRTIQDRPRLKKKYDQSKPATKRAMVGRLNERRSLVEHADAKVDRVHLDQFVASIPAWLLMSVDSLPPDAATLRIRVLYRMIFPEGTEIPVVEKPKPKASPRVAPQIAPPNNPGSASPF